MEILFKNSEVVDFCFYIQNKSENNSRYFFGEKLYCTLRWKNTSKFFSRKGELLIAEKQNKNKN